VPEGYYEPTAVSPQLVPKLPELTPGERALDELHARASAALHGRLGSDAVVCLERMHAQLSASFPDEWLLRLDVLESLIRLGECHSPLAQRLERELEQLEVRFLYREPIAAGLRSLRALGQPAIL
jgi:hypothetical protein